ncbi:MAG: quinone-dependent dihydroorotate dehydrogenase [Bacteroidota bacterium]
MYKFLKPVLFAMPAERAHHVTTALFGFLTQVPIVSGLIKRIFAYNDPSLVREFWGLRFSNPVGLAAGFDKDGKYIRAMSTLGFGFIELGTVTPRPQPGNPKPRLFRLPKDRALINRLGFNNQGVDLLVKRLKSFDKKELIIGGNIGKNKDTPNDDAHEDYQICFEKLYDHVDYFVVNLSSPNTPGLRELQGKEPLRKILTGLTSFRKKQEMYRPILLKIAPDMTQEALQDVIDIVQELSIEGIIATNTTIGRSGLTTESTKVADMGNGGLSGDPLTARSTEVIDYITKSTDGQLPVVGVGGISSGVAAKQKIDAGASLVQVYSGMVYEGPFLIKRIKRYLSQH